MCWGRHLRHVPRPEHKQTCEVQRAWWRVALVLLRFAQVSCLAAWRSKPLKVLCRDSPRISDPLCRTPSRQKYKTTETQEAVNSSGPINYKLGNSALFCFTHKAPPTALPD
ncbi:hypothetical protein E2C01_007551 [Portunus trituberculatus]|uniref:Uncharacterized protein n=1 Tax=Portunus trituberculatus TaxID=210409 RepID=A0A5B7CY76_PORTR|nr:hypothetical protein [Portunus trituberculatus]